MENNLLLGGGFVKYLDEDAKLSPSYIISDENVYSLYGSLVEGFLKKSGFKVSSVIVPASEESKSLSCYTNTISQIISSGVEKKSYIFTLGGGVVNNLGGFLASTIHRGIKLIHFPTTSLAQLDAAIDFKQAINDQHGKNLIGSFYPADHIVVDPLVLATLPARHLFNGLAEAIKHALVQDEAFLEFIVENRNNIYSRDQQVWEKLTIKTIQLKAQLMGNHDEFGLEEMIKQYGHPLGHAFEHLFIDDIYHGEAISAGMCLTAYIAACKGYCDWRTFEIHTKVFAAFGLPVHFPAELSTDDMLRVIAFDKHSIGGNAFIAYPSAPGKLYKENGKFGFFLGPDELREYYCAFQDRSLKCDEKVKKLDRREAQRIVTID